MPLKSGEFTKKEQDFIDAYVDNGGNRELAEKKAGYRKNGGYQVLANTLVQRQIASMQRAVLSDLSYLCGTWARDTMMDKSAPATIKRDITREVWKYTFGAEDGGGEAQKEPHEMSAEELADVLSSLEHEASRRARPVEDKSGSDPFD